MTTEHLQISKLKLTFIRALHIPAVHNCKAEKSTVNRYKITFFFLAKKIW
jgi:hypothetical protein